MESRVTIHNPGLTAPDVVETTGIGAQYVAPSDGQLHIGLSQIGITELTALDTTDAVVSLQLVRSATTYTLGTITVTDAVAVGTYLTFVPSSSVTLPGDDFATDLTGNPFIDFKSGDTIQCNVTTAGADAGTASGEFVAEFVVDLRSNIS